MAANDPRRRRLSARIAGIASKDPDDPRLPALRAEADDRAISEIHEWAHRAAAALPPLTADEIYNVSQLVRQVDARIARQAAAPSRPAPAATSRPASTPRGTRTA